MPRYRPPVDKRMRFAAKFDATGSGCWEWRGFKNPGGYGVLRTGSRPGRLELAHRVSWEFEHGPIPPGMQVCHTCDNPACVRPDHLFLGTLADNIRDMDEKGRRSVRRGSRVYNAKFTEDDVRAIRARWRAGEAGAAIARDYGVTNEAVYRITTGNGWRHVD